jgi:hypothetical protein
MDESGLAYELDEVSETRTQQLQYGSAYLV